MKNGRKGGGRVAGYLVVLPAVLLLGTGCTALRLERPALVRESDWLTEGDSPRRGHAVDVPLNPPLDLAWTYDAGGGFGPVSPLLLGEAVLVATRHGEVHGIRVADGKKIGTQGVGEAVDGTPAVGHGLLYVPVAWGGKVLRALDLARPAEVWSLRKAPPIEAGVLLLGQTLFVADVEGTVWALDARTGETRWTRRLHETTGTRGGAAVLATPVATGSDPSDPAGRVVVVDEQGRVAALRPGDGTPVWTRHLGRPVEVTPTTDGATLFFATTRGRLLALEAATGQVRWTFAVPDTTVRLAAPALDGRDLAVGGSDGVLRLLDAATGQVRWTFAAPDAITAPPLLTRETIYVGTMGRMLYAVNRSDGMKTWEYRLEGRVKSAMAARDGLLVVLAEPHAVYAFVPHTGPPAGTR
ncbi:MAG: hypothetical protein KatS3mg043_0908 [Rhodothermaceae bacterium]|nr:MAG: hypothetical protein KatS3mg043_0908 [Rhodothermaceae bacterium]